jgi:HTH-type transcriptional regulator, transcriptional repressor of NAD biosynthesis genes
MMKKVGLTLGKFAPLHKGHQRIIETAIAENDEVIIIIYDCPEVISVPLNIRANWIRTLYPSVRVIEAWDGPSEVGDSPEIKKKHEDYIIKYLKISGVTHFYSSEFYGEHMSVALGAENRLIDCERSTIPISSTAIRKNPFHNREYLHPLVYRDFITNVVFLGAPSTGKTTIAEEMSKQFNTVWMPEFGREYWEKHNINRRLSLNQLVEIAEGHLEREEALLSQSNKFLFVDTNAITTYIFSLYYHGEVALRLKDLAVEASIRYDIVFVCDIDIPYSDTWDRSGEVNRQAFHKQIVADLISRKIPYFLLQGDLQRRVNYVSTILHKFIKYRNIIDSFYTENNG